VSVPSTAIETDWRRLSPRMLAVHPFQEVVRAAPALVGLLFAGSQSGGKGHWWSLAAVAVTVALGMLRWFTTTYRITSQHVQVRKGLLNKKVVTVPRDRVRTVDVTSHILHRVLGLARVEVGTGMSDRKRGGELRLDALSAAEAARLRVELLHRQSAVIPGPVASPGTQSPGTQSPTTQSPGTQSPATAALTPASPAAEWLESSAASPVTGVVASPAAQAPAAQALSPGLPSPMAAAVPVPAPGGQVRNSDRETELATLRPGWIKYAPFTLSGLVTVGVIAGFLSRVSSEGNVDLSQIGPIREGGRWFRTLSLPLEISAVVLALVVFVCVASTMGYILAFWNFRLTRHNGGTLHITRGLLTTRATTIEERRLRGLEVSEPLLLRAVRGARLIAVTTGLRVGRGAQRGGSMLHLLLGAEYRREGGADEREEGIASRRSSKRPTQVNRAACPAQISGSRTAIMAMSSLRVMGTWVSRWSQKAFKGARAIDAASSRSRSRPSSRCSPGSSTRPSV
jgi:putative membrane protein